MRGKSAPSSTATNTVAAALAEGMRHHRAGDLEAAERCYRAVKRRDPNYAEAVRLRGMLAYHRGEFETAAGLLRRALKAEPANPAFHHTLAEVLRASGQSEAAIAPYRRAFRLDPERTENGLDLADTLAQAGYSEHALQTYRELLARWPTLAAAHARMARLLYERGAPETARDQLLAWQTQAPRDAHSRHALARAWVDIAEYERGAEIYRELLARDAGAARAHASLGGLLQSQGQFEEAAASFERALDIDPGQGWVYAALMSNRRYRMSEEHQDAMRRLLADEQTDQSSRVRLHFALGAWHDRNAEHAAAFAHFDRGNRIQAGLAPFDAPRFDARLERILHYFDANAFAAHQQRGHGSDKPIFVVGMPRSGTSLVEQILASHPQVFGAGELDDMRRMVRELPALSDARKPFPQCLDGLSAEQTGALAARYLGALDARAPDAARVTDKMPFNMLWLGLIARLFPNARVVYCRRDPMDNCLSCYFQLFSKGLRFAYDLAHLGHVYRQHERLMAHWAECLPLSMLTVDYETLVSDPETQTRRLIAFAGLDWDDRCLASHRTARDVRTASVWQVRQPVYQSSVARWRAYEPWLDALRNSLASGAA